MTTPQTPVEAFDAMHAHATKASPCLVDSKITLAGLTGLGHRYEVDALFAPDQSVAYPNKCVEVTVHLRVIIVDDTRLVVQLLLMWSSIYGGHSTIIEYELTKLGSEVGVVPRWQQDITPRRDLTDLDPHTGGVSAEDYHQNTLDWLRDNTNCASTGMEPYEPKHGIDPQSLATLATLVVRLTPEL